MYCIFFNSKQVRDQSNFVSTNLKITLCQNIHGLSVTYTNAITHKRKNGTNRSNLSMDITHTAQRKILNFSQPRSSFRGNPQIKESVSTVRCPCSLFNLQMCLYFFIIFTLKAEKRSIILNYYAEIYLQNIFDFCFENSC